MFSAYQFVLLVFVLIGLEFVHSHPLPLEIETVKNSCDLIDKRFCAWLTQRSRTKRATLSSSTEKKYSNFAVAADSKQCVNIGRSVLEKNGSAVDSAIATMICNGAVNFHSSGLGGGFVMLIYDKKKGANKKRFHSVIARDRAPASASAASHVNYVDGGNESVCVPGEVKGFYEAWKTFGRLPWKSLFQDTIQLLKNGFNVTKDLKTKLAKLNETDGFVFDAETWNDLLKKDGKELNEGDTITNAKLAETMEKLSKMNMTSKNPLEPFYDDLYDDMQSAKINIKRHELTSYEPILSYQQPQATYPILKGNWSDYQIYTPGFPSSGALVLHTFKVLDGFLSRNQTAQSYHRVLETMKFVSGKKMKIGDPRFDRRNLKLRVETFTSDSASCNIRNKIKDKVQEESSYGHVDGVQASEYGTTHVSVLASDGSAVALTSTINRAFGSKIRGLKTGVIFNNNMEDFDSGLTLYNRIKAGKMPRSGMSPAMVLDSQGRIRAIIGSSGGYYIPSVVTEVLLQYFNFEKDLRKSVDEGRFHAKIDDDDVTVMYETSRNGTIKDLKKELEAKGHVFSKETFPTTGVQMIVDDCTEAQKSNDTGECISAVFDYRKGDDHRSKK